MYRTTNDPRFRRRLNEIGQTLESANETAQSGIYIFGQTYVKPCFESITNCLTDCVDAGCPSLNLRNRDRLRRQRGRARSTGRAESSFDFYDDWDEDENDGLLGWGNDEFDSLVATNAGYGTIANNQPGRPRGMSYPKARRRSIQDNIINDSTNANFFSRMFGGKAVKYKPSAAGLQEHPGSKRSGRDMTEGEALLAETSQGGGTWSKSRNRSGTAASGETNGSLSSRGDLFPSDDEDDAVPLDDEFAMVLERRTTNSGNASGPDTEASSDKARQGRVRRGKRPSAASHGSSRRTVSSRSAKSHESMQNSRASSYAAFPIRASPVETSPGSGNEDAELIMPTIQDSKQEDAQDAERDEEEVESKRQQAQHSTVKSDLVQRSQEEVNSAAETAQDQDAQLPTPLATDDEEDHAERSNATSKDEPAADHDAKE